MLLKDKRTWKLPGHRQVRRVKGGALAFKSHLSREDYDVWWANKCLALSLLTGDSADGSRGSWVLKRTLDTMGQADGKVDRRRWFNRGWRVRWICCFCFSRAYLTVVNIAGHSGRHFLPHRIWSGISLVSRKLSTFWPTPNCSATTWPTIGWPSRPGSWQIM